MSYSILSSNSSNVLGGLSLRLTSARWRSCNFSHNPGRIARKCRYVSTLPVTLRCSADLDLGGNAIRHRTALEIFDHHLHTKRLLPGWNYTDVLSSTYDWFCASQSVTTIHRPENLFLDISGNDDLISSKMWMVSAGNTSITFGHSLVINDNDILALGSRVFVVIDRRTKKLYSLRKPEQESVAEILESDGNAEIEIGKYGLPEIKRFPLLDPEEIMANRKPVLTSTFGPPHMNFGNHVDHASIAEIVSHASYLVSDDNARNQSHNHKARAEATSLFVQYVSPGVLGQDIFCFQSRDDNKIYLCAENRNTKSDGKCKYNIIAIGQHSWD